MLSQRQLHLHVVGQGYQPQKWQQHLIPSEEARTVEVGHLSSEAERLRFETCIFRTLSVAIPSDGLSGILWITTSIPDPDNQLLNVFFGTTRSLSGPFRCLSRTSSRISLSSFHSLFVHAALYCII